MPKMLALLPYSNERDRDHALELARTVARSFFDQGVPAVIFCRPVVPGGASALVRRAPSSPVGPGYDYVFQDGSCYFVQELDMTLHSETLIEAHADTGTPFLRFWQAVNESLAEQGRGEIVFGDACGRWNNAIS